MILEPIQLLGLPSPAISLTGSVGVKFATTARNRTWNPEPSLPGTRSWAERALPAAGKRAGRGGISQVTSPGAAVKRRFGVRSELGEGDDGGRWSSFGVIGNGSVRPAGFQVWELRAEERAFFPRVHRPTGHRVSTPYSESGTCPGKERGGLGGEDGDQEEGGMTGVGLWVTAKEPSRRVDPAIGLVESVCEAQRPGTVRLLRT